MSLSTINWASGNVDLFGTNRTKKWVRNCKSEERATTVWISTPAPHVTVPLWYNVFNWCFLKRWGRCVERIWGCVCERACERVCECVCVYCNTLQYTTADCSTQEHTATRVFYNTLQHTLQDTLQDTLQHKHTAQHTATHYSWNKSYSSASPA